MIALDNSIKIGSLDVRNRLYRAPVLEGAGSTKNPAKTYARHFVPNAQAGVGMIIQGNTIVFGEGRTSPGMTAVSDAADLLCMRPMTDAVRAEGTTIVIQLGHGGAFALESWNAEFMAKRTSMPWSPSPLPWWLKPVHTGVHPMTTDEVDRLVARFGTVARWARDAGYDAVQLAASNAKLLHQFLSATYNRRADRYGGSIEGRAQILVAIREAIAREAGPDYPVLLKYCAREDTPFGRDGITADEGVTIAQIAEDAGYAAVTPAIASALPDTGLCRGEFPLDSFRNPRVRDRLLAAAGSRARFAAIAAGFWLSSQRYPFRPIWNEPIFRAVKDAVSVPVFAVGGIRTRGAADGILGRGDADVIGVGRPFYTEPDLPARWLSPGADPHLEPACASCNTCVVPQLLGLPGQCYNPAANRRRAELRDSMAA